MSNKHILKWALIIGIIVVLNLFFHFATRLVYKQPRWGNFCQTKQVNIAPQKKEECVEAGGSWNEGVAEKPEISPTGEVFSRPASVSKYCDVNYTCQQKFETANNLYRRNVFVILVVLGLLSVIAGFVFSASEVISLGLSYGGVLSFIIASIQYWSGMDDYLRVIILGLALAVLIWLGYKKFRE